MNNQPTVESMSQARRPPSGSIALAVSFFVSWGVVARAEEVVVVEPVTAVGIESAMAAAGAGDTIVIPDNASPYADVGLVRRDEAGASGDGQRITLQRATPGQCSFTGAFQLDITGS